MYTKRALLLLFGRAALNSHPDEHDDNVHALALAAVVLERPHAVLLLVPVRTSGAVHAAAADMRLAVRGRGLGARRDVRLLLLGVSAGSRLVERRRGHQVLDDGAVACELERGRRRAAGSRLGDDGLEHRALSRKTLGLACDVTCACDARID